MGRVTTRRRVDRIDGAARVGRPDALVVEEPLEIRVAGKPLSVTMRTPGDDFDLVTGFLTTEGVTCADDIVAIRYCAGATVDGENTYNVVDVTLADGVAPPDPSIERSFYTTSSCGVCGKASIDAIRTQTRWPVSADGCTVAGRHPCRPSRTPCGRHNGSSTVPAACMPRGCSPSMASCAFSARTSDGTTPWTR